MDIQVNANTQPAIQALERLGNKIDQIQEKFSEGFNRMNLAASALGATLIALGGSVARFADEITDVAAANDLATAEVLAFQSALASSGGKAENAAQALQRLSNAVDDANDGNMKMVGSFGRLGVSMRELATLSQSEIRNKLFTALSEIQDPMERNALAAQFFGKSLIGVDLRKFMDEQAAATAEAERFAPALETAGEAFDNMAKIIKQIKLAFAEAFEPAFALIAGFKPNVDALVVGFRLMGAALIALTAASVIRGVMALKDAFILLNAVVSKNPLIALGSAAIGVLSYIGLSKDATTATEDLGKSIEENGRKIQQGIRPQEGYNDKLEKARESIARAGEELRKNFSIAAEKNKLDLAGFSLSEEQRKQAEARAKIDQDANTAREKALAAFNQLDRVTQATQRAKLDDELAGIEAARMARKKNSDEEIAQLEQRNRLNQQIQFATDLNEKFNQTITDRIVANRKDVAGSEERIRLEQRLAEISAYRSQLTQSASRLSQEDRMKAQVAADMALSDSKLLDTSYANIGQTLNDNLRKYSETVGLSEKSTQSLINGNNILNSVIAETGKNTTEQAILADRVAKSFSQGWNKAFVSYYESANNAASQAQRLFERFTSGVEDAFVRFAKTGKLSFRDLLSSIAEDILRSNIKQLLANVFSPMTSGQGGGILDTLFSAGKSLLGFANGGIIPTNGPVVVGERGPEILSGAAGRTVTPNNQLGSTYVTYNIQAVDAASFKSLVARDPAFIHAVASQGAKSVPSRR